MNQIRVLNRLRWHHTCLVSRRIRMESILGAVHACHHIFHHWHVLPLRAHETVSVRRIINLDSPSYMVILSRCALATVWVVECLVHVVTTGFYSATQGRSMMVSHVHSTARVACIDTQTVSTKTCARLPHHILCHGRRCALPYLIDFWHSSERSSSICWNGLWSPVTLDASDLRRRRSLVVIYVGKHLLMSHLHFHSVHILRGIHHMHILVLMIMVTSRW